MDRDNEGSWTMTHRERFLTSLTGGRPERFFRYEHGAWPQTAERWRQEAGPGRSEGLEPYEFGSPYFKMDPFVRMKINSGFTDSPYYPKIAERTIELTKEHRIYVDGDGITKKELIYDKETSMPQFMHFPVGDRAQWEAILPHLNPADADARIGDVAGLRAIVSNPDVPNMLPICGAFGHPRNLMGDEGLGYMMFDDPGLLDEMLVNWLAVYKTLLRRLTASVRVDVLLVWEDMCYRNGPLISPEHFRRFMLEPYIELVRCARECGIGAVLVDTDGDCLSMIPLFLEAGVDALMPFEVQAGMDVVAIGKKFPSLSIVGGLDKRVLAGDSRPAIKAEVDRVLPYFVDRGGYIPTLDHTVPPNVSLDNYLYYLDCVRSYETA